MSTRQTISEWFDAGIKQKASHMLVVVDTFDNDDYPVYAATDADCLEQYASYDKKNMQRVMEVYDLRMDKAGQLAETRAFHLPKVAV